MVDTMVRLAPDPPPSFPIQDMNHCEPLLHQFSGEPQIVPCLAISQLTGDTALSRATGSEATTLKVGLHSSPMTMTNNLKGTYVSLHTESPAWGRTPILCIRY